MGSFGYNIYKQDGTFLGFTNQTTYTVNASNGNQSYIVKTAYSNFRATESGGKSVSVNVTGAKDEKDDEKDKEKEDDKEKDTVMPICPDGYTLDNNGDKCTKDSSTTSSTCPSGYTFDSSIKKCKKG